MQYKVVDMVYGWITCMNGPVTGLVVVESYDYIFCLRSWTIHNDAHRGVENHDMVSD